MSLGAGVTYNLLLLWVSPRCVNTRLQSAWAAREEQRDDVDHGNKWGFALVFVRQLVASAARSGGQGST